MLFKFMNSNGTIKEGYYVQTTKGYQAGVRYTADLSKLNPIAGDCNLYTVEDIKADKPKNNDNSKNATWIVPDNAILSNTFSGITKNQGYENITIICPNASIINEEAFSQCDAIVSISSHQVTTIGANAFQNCTSLTSLELPSVQRINSGAFKNCTSLTSLELPSANELSDNVFDNSGIKTLRLTTRASQTNYSSSSFDNFTTNECVLILSADNYNSNMTDIGSNEWVYKSWKSIINIDEQVSYTVQEIIDGKPKEDNREKDAHWNITDDTIAESALMDRISYLEGYSNITITLSNATNIEKRAFFGCPAITKLFILKDAVIGEKSFYGCRSLSTVKMNLVTTIGEDAFWDCMALVDVVMPNVANIGEGAFYLCSSIKELNLPKLITVGDSAFNSCTSLTSFKAANLVISTNVFNLFTQCTNLEEVYIPKMEIAGTRMFNLCNKLKSISLPAATRIMAAVFYKCSSLESVELPEATEVHFIAFSYCTSLTALSLPKLVKFAGYEGNSFFNNCDKLTTIKFTAPSVIEFDECTGDDVFRDFNTENCELHLAQANYDNVTGGNTWAGKSWKSIVLVDNVQ